MIRVLVAKTGRPLRRSRRVVSNGKESRDGRPRRGSMEVAYADFVTAMMAFFMAMWITAQSKQVKMAVSATSTIP